MRDIKFRAWSPEQSIMVLVDVLICLAGGSFKVFYGDEKELQTMFDPVVMQFTGLLDKNGKEIYEGDIIRISNFNMVGHEDTKSESPIEIFEDIECEVLFDDAGFVFESDDHGLIPLNVMGEKDYEIVGNIYQNPFHPEDAA